ncbi:hypothetical protein GCM10023144_13600 [Pigmentiphaga soli]|uniref:DUF2135 domain-containing protein n=1 Tax=Pigmentiphaga soli TaxID=1007095 RepID=A0ABP8GPR9_9BURK
MPAFLFHAAPATAVPAPMPLCEPAGYVVGFFNGVWNTRAQADESLRHLRETAGEVFDGARLDYELFYNQTGIGRAGASALEDIAEVFIQRADELDGALSNRWEIFWELLAGAPGGLAARRRAADVIAEAGPALKDLLHAVYTDLIAKSAAGWSALLSDPPLASAYAAQRTRIQGLLAEGRKLILVAHSQGNLFMNQAYREAAAKAGSGRIRAIHVAPASPTLSGPHVLADLDLVINALRLQGAASVPPITAYLPAGHLLTDPSGHMFAATYLATDLQSGQQTADALQAALRALVTPGSPENAGFFTATITWDGPGDVDLHVAEPGGAHVYYRQRHGDSGYLDTDDTVADGPEHYYATCDAARLLPGIYQIGINPYASTEARRVTLQIATAADGEVFSRTTDAGPARGDTGNDTPRPIVRVEVTHTEAGAWRARVLPG